MKGKRKMKVAKIRIRKGIRKSIKETQKLYDFICPLKNVDVGNYVVVEVKNKRNENFHVGRVEEIVEITEDEMLVKKLYSYVVCLIPVKDFDKRCKKITNMKFKQFSKYNNTYHHKKCKKDN